MLKFNDFFNSYLNALTSSLKNTDTNQIYKSAKLILDTIKKNKKIFVCGNGGSAAISNHYICDYLKFFREHTKLKPQIYSLSTNIETVTAISNDINYDQIFSYQAESLCSTGDLMIIISSSGNSKNVIKLLKYTKKKKIKTIGFSGFKGGFLKRNSDISIYIKANNYGISEDSHHILMHLILQYIIHSLNKKKFLI